MSSSLRFAFNPSLLALAFTLCACTNGSVIVGDFEDGGRDAMSNPDGHVAIDLGPNADLGMDLGTDAGSDAGEVNCASPWQATAVGLCDAELGALWNGVSCEIISGCTCEGPDCPAVVRSDDTYDCYEEVRARGCELYDIMIVNQSGNETTETGGTVSFGLELTRRPSADVFVSMSTSDSAEGVVTPSSATFTSTVSYVFFSVTGLDDSIADGDQIYYVTSSDTVSTDPTFSALSVPNLALLNRDDDGVCINVVPSGEVSLLEGGDGQAFSVTLCDAPTEDTVVTATSDDTSEGVVSPTALTFTPADWNVPQVVALEPVDDLLADGPVEFQLRFSTHASPSPDDVLRTVTTYDDDTAGFIVSGGDGLTTTENGGTAIFTVALTRAPSSDVTISLASSNPSEGTVSPSTLRFDGASALAPQTVTVTGVDDEEFDGDTPFMIISGAATSVDPGYDLLTVPDVSVTNQYIPLYIKASDTSESDYFGDALAMSADGNTLVVGARAQGGPTSFGTGPGAVYVYTRSAGAWSPTPVVLRGSNTERADGFGNAVSISSDGNTIVVGAQMEESGSASESDNSAYGAGAAYVFTRSGGGWAQQAYLKASNVGEGDHFGAQVELSTDGNTLAVAATSERSNATGVGGNQADNSLLAAGAVYLFARSGSTWAQQAYVKASNPDEYDEFGTGLALSGDGATLAVGAIHEASSATGIDGNQSDDSTTHAGAVYVFARSGSAWTQQTYVKASVTSSAATELFGSAIALSTSGEAMVVVGGSAAYAFARSSGVWTQNARIENPRGGGSVPTPFRSLAMSSDNNTLLIGTPSDSSSARRMDGSESDSSAPMTGGAYRFVRSGGTWSRANYIKAPNADTGDAFGTAVAMPADASIFVVGAGSEDSAASGIDGDSANNAASNAGAVYIFR
ncbi:MAG: hypothetical protein IPK60_10870 [Sandaracinaceae bacterium]|nr:hypothetical protein [Sandaracinaceae bacterium]